MLNSPPNKAVPGLEFFPTAITASVCLASGSGGKPNSLSTKSSGPAQSAGLTLEHLISVFELFPSQANLGLHLPEQVLGGDSGGKGEVVDRL